MKEGILETAGEFVEYVSKISEGNKGGEEKEDQMEYKGPTKYSYAKLTVGEVAELILDALSYCDNPMEKKNIKMFFSYFSDNNLLKKMVHSIKNMPNFQREMIPVMSCSTFWAYILRKVNTTKLVARHSI